MGKLKAWWTETGWPGLKSGAARWFKALYGDPFMHVVTAALAAGITKAFW